MTYFLLAWIPSWTTPPSFPPLKMWCALAFNILLIVLAVKENILDKAHNALVIPPLQWNFSSCVQNRMHRFKWKDRLIRRCSNMRIFFKLFKFLLSYPFLFGLLTSVVINYGDWWLVNFKYILYEDDSLIHIKR